MLAAGAAPGWIQGWGHEGGGEDSEHRAGSWGVMPLNKNAARDIKGFHVGDARVKKLTPASKRSIGRHVEF